MAALITRKVLASSILRLSCALAFLEQTAGSFQRRATDAEIGKTCFRHFRLRKNIASVQDNGRLQKMFDAGQIEIGKLLPLRQDQQCICAINGSVGVSGILDSAA